MLNISTTLKGAALASILGVAAVVGGAKIASAETYTRCSADGDCVREHCDAFGNDCWREHVYYRDYRDRDAYHPYFRGYYGGYGDRHWVCDADGDDCHWVYD
jgi:hypothetical protein